jgi:hypothetical protein
MKAAFSAICIAAAVCSAKVIDLNDENFEHDTQATTGSTTGDWLVAFHRSGVSFNQYD